LRDRPFRHDMQLFRRNGLDQVTLKSVSALLSRSVGHSVPAHGDHPRWARRLSHFLDQFPPVAVRKTDSRSTSLRGRDLFRPSCFFRAVKTVCPITSRSWIRRSLGIPHRNPKEIWQVTLLGGARFRGKRDVASRPSSLTCRAVTQLRLPRLLRLLQWRSVFDPLPLPR
jgi:hypothetical protein